MMLKNSSLGAILRVLVFALAAVVLGWPMGGSSTLWACAGPCDASPCSYRAASEVSEEPIVRAAATVGIRPKSWRRRLHPSVPVTRPRGLMRGCGTACGQAILLGLLTKQNQGAHRAQHCLQHSGTQHWPLGKPCCANGCQCCARPCCGGAGAALLLSLFTLREEPCPHTFPPCVSHSRPSEPKGIFRPPRG